MVKKIIIVLLLVSTMFVLCGCENSSDAFITKVTSGTKAYIKVQGRTLVIDVNSYLFGANGVVAITGTDGKNYKTHSVNVVIVKEGELNE